MPPIIERASLLRSKPVQNTLPDVHYRDALVRRSLCALAAAVRIAHTRRAGAANLITGMSFASTRSNS